MPWISCAVCLLTLSALLSLTEGDAEASCVFMESCVLPCSFQDGTSAVIRWTCVARNTLVHSYYNNQDQLAGQDQRFKNRTSLFKDQIFRGNASLQLIGVEVQDQGRYKCFTSTISSNKELFINLKVDAPVRKVNIQQVENRITCSSEGIYPEPELTWSTKPPSALTFENTTTVQQTDQQLYNINSSLTLSDSVTDLVYSCNVSTDRNWRRATLRQLSSVSVSSTDTTIPCSVFNASLTGFSLIWRFNQSQIILNQTGVNVSPSVSEGWRQQVKGVSESGGLTLKGLTSNQEGIFTCELSNAEETYVANIFLRIEKGSQTDVAGIIVAVVFGVILAILLVLCYIYKKTGRRPDMVLRETSLCLVCREGEQVDVSGPNPRVVETNIP